MKRRSQESTKYYEDHADKERESEQGMLGAPEGEVHYFDGARRIVSGVSVPEGGQRHAGVWCYYTGTVEIHVEA